MRPGERCPVHVGRNTYSTIVRRRHRLALLRNTLRDCSLNTVVPLVDTDLRYYVICDVFDI